MTRVSGVVDGHNKGGVGHCVPTVELIHHIPIFSKKLALLYHITIPYFVKH
jgi:hypothetical protein